jgi:hypothetical protein
MNATLANEPAVKFGFGRGWATSITTAGNDIVVTPITSDSASRREQQHFIPISILHYYAALGALPANRGRTFFIEEPSDQAGFITDAIASSTHIPHFVAASAWTSEFWHRYYPALLPSAFYPDEMLDWDASIEKAPTRPSGTLIVTLEYAGRGKPTPVEDPWD